MLLLLFLRSRLEISASKQREQIMAVFDGMMAWATPHRFENLWRLGDTAWFCNCGTLSSARNDQCRGCWRRLGSRGTWNAGGLWRVLLWHDLQLSCDTHRFCLTFLGRVLADENLERVAEHVESCERRGSSCIWNEDRYLDFHPQDCCRSCWRIHRRWVVIQAFGRFCSRLTLHAKLVAQLQAYLQALGPS